MTADTTTSAWARRASAARLALAAVAVAGLALRLILEAVRPSDECGTAFTVAFEWLIWTAIVSSALALVVGIASLAAGSDRVSWTLGGIGLALGVGVLMFVPGVAIVVCWEATA